MGTVSSSNGASSKNVVTHPFCVPDITFDCAEIPEQLIEYQNSCPKPSENADDISCGSNYENNNGHVAGQKINRSSDSINSLGLRRLKVLGMNRRLKDSESRKSLPNRMSLVEPNAMYYQHPCAAEPNIESAISKSVFHGSKHSSVGTNSHKNVKCVSMNSDRLNLNLSGMNNVPSPYYAVTRANTPQEPRHVRFDRQQQASKPKNVVETVQSYSNMLDDHYVYSDNNNPTNLDIQSLSAFNSTTDSTEIQYKQGSLSIRSSSFVNQIKPDSEQNFQLRRQVSTHCVSPIMKPVLFTEQGYCSPICTRHRDHHFSLTDSSTTPPPDVRKYRHQIDFYPYYFNGLTLDAPLLAQSPLMGCTNIEESHSGVNSGMEHDVKPSIPPTYPSERHEKQRSHGSPNSPVPQKGPNEKYAGRCKNLTKSFSCYALRFFANHQTQQRPKEKGRQDGATTQSTAAMTNKGKRKNTSLKQTTRLADRRKGTCSANRSSVNSVEEGEYKQSFAGEVSWPISVDETQCEGSHKPRGASFSLYSKRNRYRPSYEPHVNVIYSVQPTKMNSVQCAPDVLNIGQQHFIHTSCQNESRRTGCHWLSTSNIGSFVGQKCSIGEWKQTILRVSTSELLRCLSHFVVTRLQILSLKHSVHTRTSTIHRLQPSVIVSWVKAIDRALLLQGWSDVSFLNPANVIFLFMMVKECIGQSITSERELHTIIMACLYLSYSYMGNEISYPLKPFLVAETNQLLGCRDGQPFQKGLEYENALMSEFDSSIRSKVVDQVRSRFWQYCLRIMNRKSSGMLQINASPVRFTELFTELRSYQQHSVSHECPQRMASTPS